MIDNNVVKTYKISDTKELRIIQDGDVESPRTSCDNLGTMICFHNRYNLGDKHEYSSSSFNNWNELKEQIKKDHDIAVILPLYLYDHSGITISTEPFSCNWDSGQIGWAFVSKETVRKELDYKRIPKRSLEWTECVLKHEVQTYDQFLTGDTYGFELVEKSTCESCEDDHEKILDSCWGFYGSDLRQNGILSHLDNDSREIIAAQL